LLPKCVKKVAVEKYMEPEVTIAIG